MSAAQLAGENDLRRAVDEVARFTSGRALGPDLYEVTLEAREVALRAGPGEFAQLLVSPDPVPLLRRPFSFSRADPGAGTVSFYLRAFGEGTRRLIALTPGQEVRVLGPLGRGFTLSSPPGRSLLVSGGLGAAPFPLLADRLLSGGGEVVWLNGAATSSQLYPPEMLPQGISELVQVTEDGSQGRRGRVTDLLPALLGGVSRVYACGPNAMLAAVAAQTAAPATGPRLEVSVEAPMGCGFGTCLGCAIPLRDPARPDASPTLGLCCRQGPVLDARLVDWPRLQGQPAHLE